MNDSFIDRIRAARKKDDDWIERKGELSRMKKRREPLPKHWEQEDGLLY